MYMEVFHKEVYNEPFKLVGHLVAQCQVCGAIVRTSNRARHLKTIKHCQAKNRKHWMYRYFMVSVDNFMESLNNLPLEN
jgi:hypothetical protein